MIEAFCGCGRVDSNSVSSNASLSQNSDFEDNICEQIKEDKTCVSDSVSINNTDLKVSCDDFDINRVIDKELVLSGDEEIEYAEWVEEKEVFRIAIKRNEEFLNEYNHSRDYFFIKKDDCVHAFVVDYPSKKESRDSDRYVFDACDFCAEYLDVNFDNNKDLIIFLGYDGSHAYKRYCAYLSDEGEYRYEKSFEEIPNFEIDNEKKLIKGSYVSGGETYYPKYEFKDGIFVKVSE